MYLALVDDGISGQDTPASHRVGCVTVGRRRLRFGDRDACRVDGANRSARAFSGHRFEEAFDYLAEDVVWNLVGLARLEGRDAVVAACNGTTAENVDVTTSWGRFVSTGDGDTVAVDAIGRYEGPGSVLDQIIAGIATPRLPHETSKAPSKGGLTWSNCGARYWD